MKIYFSSRSIPGLSHFPLTERLAAISQAQQKLTVPEKFCLNLLKLAILLPVFILIFRVSDNWFSLLWAALVALIYPLVIKPIQYGLCAKYIPQPEQQGK
ncbi:MAG: hypothetical protein ACI8R9_002418 [Paraglaciecola sp.]|jgi:hypothetical protein